MQEEVTQKTIALYVKVGKGAARLTEQALQKAIQKFLEQKSKPAHGKQTMRQLMKQNAGVSNIEITDSNPILVRNVAEVREGVALRYGASTKDGKGEIVCGMALMLKGENSSAVVNRVKEKMDQINKTLPEGVVAEAFIDRGKLVDSAVGTVTKNLLEGALIVIFVLILFLGNLRAGLIVASVIPLSMLFAVI